jgi:hypothetical protein
MATLTFTAEEWAEGEQRLRDLLSQAQAAASPAKAMRWGSAHGQAFAMCCHEGNLKALIVHGSQQRGWWVDLVLKDLPAGMSNTIGTHSGSPW